MGNNPIMAIDPDRGYIYWGFLSAEQQAIVKATLDNLSKSSVAFAAVIEHLENSDFAYAIKSNTDISVPEQFDPYSLGGGRIEFLDFESSFNYSCISIGHRSDQRSKFI